MEAVKWNVMTILFFFLSLLSRTNVKCTSGTYGPYDTLSNGPLNNGPRMFSHHEPNHHVTAAPSSPDHPRGDNSRVSRLLALTRSPQYAVPYTLSTVQFGTAKWSTWLSISSWDDFKSMMKCLALEDCIRISLYIFIIVRRGNNSSLCCLATSLTAGEDRTCGLSHGFSTLLSSAFYKIIQKQIVGTNIFRPQTEMNLII